MMSPIAKAKQSMSACMSAYWGDERNCYKWGQSVAETQTVHCHFQIEQKPGKSSGNRCLSP
jgi:hypothetical protein